MEKQNPSPEKVVEDLKQYLKEIKERIEFLNKFLDEDNPRIETRIAWEELVRTKSTIEKILGFPNNA